MSTVCEDCRECYGKHYQDEERHFYLCRFCAMLRAFEDFAKRNLSRIGK